MQYHPWKIKIKDKHGILRMNTLVNNNKWDQTRDIVPPYFSFIGNE